MRSPIRRDEVAALCFAFTVSHLAELESAGA
jgi:hypothetical protein